MSKAELLQCKIDTIFDRYELKGYDTGNKLKYTYRFSDRDRIPIIEMGKGLERDSIEVIYIKQIGKRWEIAAFENEVYSRESMIEKERELKWMMFKYKVDDYLGFTISPADIDISDIPDDEFFPFIKSLESDDLFNVAMRRDKVKDHLKSMLAFQELIDRKFKLDTSYFKMGSALIGTNEFVKGIEHWQEAVKLNPDYLEAHMRLGNIFFENSHWKQAHQHFKEADRIKPNDDDVLYHLAKSLIKLERYNEAYTTIRRAIKLNPKNQYARGVLDILKTPTIRKLRKQFPDK